MQITRTTSHFKGNYIVYIFSSATFLPVGTQLITVRSEVKNNKLAKFIFVIIFTFSFHAISCKKFIENIFRI